MVAKPAPCWQYLEERHQFNTAGPKGITCPTSLTHKHQGPTQIGVSEQGEGEVEPLLD